MRGAWQAANHKLLPVRLVGLDPSLLPPPYKGLAQLVYLGIMLLLRSVYSVVRSTRVGASESVEGVAVGLKAWSQKGGDMV